MESITPVFRLSNSNGKANLNSINTLIHGSLASDTKGKIRLFHQLPNQIAKNLNPRFPRTIAKGACAKRDLVLMSMEYHRAPNNT